VTPAAMLLDPDGHVAHHDGQGIPLGKRAAHRGRAAGHVPAADRAGEQTLPWVLSRGTATAPGGRPVRAAHPSCPMDGSENLRRNNRHRRDLARNRGEIYPEKESYDGIPLLADDFILDNRTVGTSTGVCSTIYAVQFGYGRGLMGLHNGGIQVEEVGELESKDATRRRVKWYAALANFRDIAVAALEGITNA